MTNENLDIAIGRATEAASALSAGRRLKNERRLGQAKGSVNNAANKVAVFLAKSPSLASQH
jgi:hypothetical protein